MNSDDVYVWAFANGTVKGQTIEPLYRSVPQTAIDDPQLYQFLCLIDALRVGRIREQKLAIFELIKRLNK